MPRTLAQPDEQASTPIFLCPWLVIQLFWNVQKTFLDMFGAWWISWISGFVCCSYSCSYSYYPNPFIFVSTTFDKYLV